MAPSTVGDEVYPFLTVAQAQRIRGLMRWSLQAAGVPTTIHPDRLLSRDGRAFGLGDVMTRCRESADGPDGWRRIVDDHVAAALRSPAPEVAPDVAAPEIVAPEVAVPDVASDVAVPDVAVPDVAVPGVAVPGVAPVAEDEDTGPRWHDDGIPEGVEALLDACLLLVPADAVPDPAAYAYGLPVAPGLVEVLSVHRDGRETILAGRRVEEIGRRALRSVGLRALRQVDWEEYEVLRGAGPAEVHVLRGGPRVASLLLALDAVLARVLGAGAVPVDGVTVAVSMPGELAFCGADDPVAIRLLADRAGTPLYRWRAGTITLLDPA